MDWPTWREATEVALYGPDGFFRHESPAEHFRTSVHAAPDLLAAALLRLARASGSTTVVDLGAGGGELIAALERVGPDLTLAAVELSARPDGLPDRVAWSTDLPDRLDQVLLIANEWLDNVPVDVVEVDERGMVRLVHVDPATGTEALGATVSGPAAAWLDRWWPMNGAEVGMRAEVGLPRDQAWAAVVKRVAKGLVIAVDYAHYRGDRPLTGTLTGYRGGQIVRPVPDGSCDLTSHVALDACAAAGAAVGATETLLTRQRDALRLLGVDGTPPSRDWATTDPQGYLAALADAGRAAELLSVDGLGGFGWLVQTVGTRLPDLLRGA